MVVASLQQVQGVESRRLGARALRSRNLAPSSLVAAASTRCCRRTLLPPPPPHASACSPLLHSRAPQVKAVVFSRDGRLLAAAGATAAIHVWDLPNYFERHSLACDVTVNALAFTADALLLASGGMDKKVRVWDTATGACLQELLHDDYVLALAFAPAQRAPELPGLVNPPILAAGGGDKLISIWNAGTGERKSTLARDATVYAITFSPTGDLLTTGGGDKQASLWSRHGRLLAESPSMESAVKALAFSMTGTELASATGKEVRLSTIVSDPNTGESRLKPHMNEEVSRIVNLPLLRATKEGDLDEVDSLLEMGLVDVNFANQHGDTPLILACWYGHKYIAARLLDSGALLDITNCDGNCALNVAAYRGNSEAVEMLLRHRATVDVPDHMTGKTALVKAAYVGHTPTAIALLDAKADVNAADNQGYTSLAFATSFNHEYMLQVLLHSDADPNIQDVFGITPLIHAASQALFESGLPLAVASCCSCCCLLLLLLMPFVALAGASCCSLASPLLLLTLATPNSTGGARSLRHGADAAAGWSAPVAHRFGGQDRNRLC